MRIPRRSPGAEEVMTIRVTLSRLGYSEARIDAYLVALAARRDKSAPKPAVRRGRAHHVADKYD